MGLVTGEFKHPTLKDVEVTVDSKERGSVREDWEIVNLDIAFASIRTPHDLIILGQWLVTIGTDIPMKFNPNGTKKRKRDLPEGQITNGKRQ